MQEDLVSCNYFQIQRTDFKYAFFFYFFKTEKVTERSSYPGSGKRRPSGNRKNVLVQWKSEHFKTHDWSVYSSAVCYFDFKDFVFLIFQVFVFRTPIFVLFSVFIFEVSFAALENRKTKWLVVWEIIKIIRIKVLLKSVKFVKEF